MENLIVVLQGVIIILNGMALGYIYVIASEMKKERRSKIE